MSKITKKLVTELLGHDQAVAMACFAGAHEMDGNILQSYMNLDEILAFLGGSWTQRNRYLDGVKEIVETSSMYEIIDDLSRTEINKQNIYQHLNSILGENPDLKEELDKHRPYRKNNSRKGSPLEPRILKFEEDEPDKINAIKESLCMPTQSYSLSPSSNGAIIITGYREPRNPSKRQKRRAQTWANNLGSILTTYERNGTMEDIYTPNEKETSQLALF